MPINSINLCKKLMNDEQIESNLTRISSQIRIHHKDARILSMFSQHDNCLRVTWGFCSVYPLKHSIELWTQIIHETC